MITALVVVAVVLLGLVVFAAVFIGACWLLGASDTPPEEWE